MSIIIYHYLLLFFSDIQRNCVLFAEMEKVLS